MRRIVELVLFDDAGIRVLDAKSGEVALLADASMSSLAHASDYLGEQGRLFRSARNAVNDELIERLGRERLASAGRFDVAATERREWDPDATWAALSDLVAAELITATEADEAMPEVATRKPDGRRLNAILTRLAGEDPAAASALAQARSSTTSIKVTPTAIDGTVEDAA